MPLIDAQTCDTYYHENSGIPTEEPIILEDMLCAGFESGQKDACGVSKHARLGLGLPLPVTTGDPPRAEESNIVLDTSINSKKMFLDPASLSKII